MNGAKIQFTRRKGPTSMPSQGNMRVRSMWALLFFVTFMLRMGAPGAEPFIGSLYRHCADPLSDYATRTLMRDDGEVFLVECDLDGDGRKEILVTWSGAKVDDGNSCYDWALYKRTRTGFLLLRDSVSMQTDGLIALHDQRHHVGGILHLRPDTYECLVSLKAGVIADEQYAKPQADDKWVTMDALAVTRIALHELADRAALSVYPDTFRYVSAPEELPSQTIYRLQPRERSAAIPSRSLYSDDGRTTNSGLGAQHAQALQERARELASRSAEERLDSVVWMNECGGWLELEGRGIQPRIILLEDADWRVRTSTADSFVAGDLGNDDSIAKLVALCGHANREERWGALMAIGRHGSQAISVVPDLFAAVRQHFTYDFANALGEAIKLMGVGAAPQIIRALKRKDLRNIALGVVCRAGPVAESAVPQIVDCLDDPNADGRTRRGAAIALGKIGPQASGAMPSLVNALRNEDPYVRADAA